MRSLAALALLAAVGCATTAPEDRDWVRLETPHFEIVSALSPAASRELARDLERFRGAVAWAQGGSLPTPNARIQVRAFNGRTLVRPFDQRGEPSYFLPRVDGGLLVLRTGGGLRGDATVEVRHELAHWILRGAGGPVPPLWIDEGFAQLLSTIEVDDHTVEVGRLREDHLRLVRSETWLPAAHLLAANPGDDWSDRSRFDAQTWLLVHYLLLGQTDRGAVNQQLRRYLLLLERGVRPGEAAETAFDADLDRQLNRYARRERLYSLEVVIPFDGVAAPIPLTRGEALLELGLLALAIGRNERAAGYLESSVSAQPGQARAHAALGEAYTKLGRGEETQVQLQLALGLDAADARVQRQAGDYYRDRAQRVESADERAELLRLARWHYGQSLALAPSASVEARLAETALIDGQAAPVALEAARAAARLQPASLELKLLQGRAELAAGNRGSARVLAREVWARAHGKTQREEARELLARSSSFPRQRGALEADPLHAQR
jgi:tetratricopeptide (TPR) repeat protein